jgi:hypothetical protein
VHGNGSELGVFTGVKPVSGQLLVRGKDQYSTHGRWPVSEHSAEEKALELERVTAVVSTARMVACPVSGTSKSTPAFSPLRDQAQGLPMASSPRDFSRHES